METADTNIGLTADLRELLTLATNEDAVEHLLRRGLDMLTRIAPYDLATVFMLQGGELVARVARGRLADERVRAHRLSLADFPSLREALETRRARAFTEDDHSHGDGDPFDGVLDLPAGHSCMVVPLCSGEACHGVMTLDRSVCEPYGDEVVNLVEVYGQILAIAVQNAREKVTLGLLHEQDHEHAKQLEAVIGGDAIPLLEAPQGPAMEQLVYRAKQVAKTDTPVLILGETGTGKERLARAIHQWSPRYDQPMVSLNCAAIPANLIESELFGHIKGAFSGATKDRPGRFQTANGGTLFLDEVGELPLELQAKLLRVLQEGSFEPVGSDTTVHSNVRIVTATNVDLEKAVEERRFREDLYYRLNVFPLEVPPLRERLDILPHACAILLAQQSARTGKRGYQVTAAAIEKLRQYDWPGNLRELANALERAVILAGGKTTLGPDDFDLGTAAKRPRASSRSGGRPPEPLEAVERRHIAATLEYTKGKIYGPGGAAEALGLKPSTLQSRMKKLGIGRSGLRPQSA